MPWCSPTSKNSTQVLPGLKYTHPYFSGHLVLEARDKPLKKWAMNLSPTTIHFEFPNFAIHLSSSHNRDLATWSFPTPAGTRNLVLAVLLLSLVQ